jgi:hypothetical protein
MYRRVSPDAYVLSINDLKTGAREDLDLLAMIGTYGVDSVRWAEGDQALYYVSKPYEATGVAPPPYKDKLMRLDLKSGSASVVRDCPGCLSFDISNTGLLAAVRSITPYAPLQLDIVGWTDPFTTPLMSLPGPIAWGGPLSFSPSGKKLAYSIKELRNGRPYFPTLIYDLENHSIVTLTENLLLSAWLSDDVVLEPDEEALRIWQHDLATRQRTVFAEFTPAVLPDYVESNHIASVMISSDRRFLLFEPALNGTAGPLLVADLRCVAADK